VSDLNDTTLPEPPVPTSGRGARPTVAGVLVVFSRRASPLVPVPVTSPSAIGREPSAAIVVDDPSVSRLHARFEPAKDGLLVADLGSHNGTFLSGTRIDGSVVAPFGSIVRVGSTIALVVADCGALVAEGPPAAGLVGGPGLAELRTRIAAIAASPATVLVEGETGSGKEIVTRAIHEASGRAGDLVAVNCAAIASELVESELFGHSRGAFSGSQGARAGLFRAADRGTLLLDEIGELKSGVQAKLLRVLETGEVRGVGEDRGVRVDVRVVAATHRDLSQLVARGVFRSDLLHRVAAIRVRVPPLRDHVEDIPCLCEFFLREQTMELAAPALESLLLRDWPGNVRELRNVVLAAAAIARYDGRKIIGPHDIDDAQLSVTPDVDVDTHAGTSASAEDESARARIVAALEACDGNVTRAATQLSMSRSVLYETIRRLRIDARAHRRR